mmetsp:Transcript_52320/g.154424  ORF Transcript_52320/g.154424 Transcript_52320/m.154424 type:complete len:129 (-) Transcript_52320:314-700(-)
MRARAAAAESEVAELQRQLRGKASELRGIATKNGAADGGGGPSTDRRRGGGGKGAAKLAALQSELAQKQQQIEEMDEQLQLLKGMVRGQRAETRSKEIQNVALRKKVRAPDPGEVPQRAVKLPPIGKG